MVMDTEIIHYFAVFLKEFQYSIRIKKTVRKMNLCIMQNKAHSRM